MCHDYKCAKVKVGTEVDIHKAIAIMRPCSIDSYSHLGINPWCHRWGFWVFVLDPPDAAGWCHHPINLTRGAGTSCLYAGDLNRVLSSSGFKTQ